MHDAITIGSSTIDYFIYTDNKLVRKKSGKQELTMIAYPLGSKILVKNLIVATGGGGTNVAATFSKFGLKTGWYGVVGNDDAGKKVISEIKKLKIDFLGKIKNGITGTSFILDSIGHDRTVLAYKGVNNDFNASDINLRRIDSKLVYLTSLTGKSFGIYKKILPAITKKKTTVVLNPSTYMAKMGAVKLSGVLRYVNILICNDEEAQLLVGKKKLEDMAKNISKYGPRVVVITRGNKGVFCYDGSYYYEINAHKVKVAESLGAGDAFGSAFSAAFLKTKNIEISLKYGMVNAESVIQKVGAKKGILTWNEAKKRINNNYPVRKVKA